jgi:hypothetical protein
MIEKALVQNKQHVYEFSKNSSIVDRLREEATKLTLQLTREIQREIEQQHNQPFEEKSRKFQNNFNSLIIYISIERKKIEKKFSIIKNSIVHQDSNIFTFHQDIENLTYYLWMF